MKIKLISTSKELALVRRIRKKVLELEQGFPHEVNIDGNDPRAVHALIYDGHKPVATARLLPTEKGRGKIARIAIIKSHRGMGLARNLIRYLEKKAKMMCLTTVGLEPHSYLEDFFQRLGYQRLLGTTEVAGVPLIKLEKQLISNYKVNNEES